MNNNKLPDFINGRGYNFSGNPRIPIWYAPCPCRERYYLSPENPLAKYLETECQGWIRDFENRYTLNYILMILSYNLKQKKLLEYDYEFSYYYVRCDEALEKLTEKKYLYIDSLRSYLNRTFLEKQEPELGTTEYQSVFYVFLCLGKATKLKDMIFSEDIFDFLHETHCKQLE